MIHAAYRCPGCRAGLDADSASLQCPKCGVTYPVGNQIADFAGGAYYDNFTDASALSPEHLRGLELEKDGATTRIAAYYLPRIASVLCGGGRPRPPVPRRAGAPATTQGLHARVLDAGCGNGISVD